MDLFCNQVLVRGNYKDGYSMHLKSNGGTMVVTRKVEMPGYHKTVWFSKRAITNIIALRKLTQQYRVTNDSDDLIFVVHRESENKPNMEFRTHESGLHYYDPRKNEQLALVNTVSENKTDQGCRNRENSVRHAELPVHEGLQVCDSKQPNQRLPCYGPRRRRCPQYLGEEHCCVEREDHSEQNESGG
jgi:hypothetical protein